MFLFRVILFAIVIFLIVRLFTGSGSNKGPFSGKSDLEKQSDKNSKKVSKEIGEYVDYEDVKKDKT
jgi:hypothetical protein